MITFQHLQDNGQIPANSFKVIDGKLHLDVGVLIGESVTTLNSPKLVEMLTKLLIGAYQAQTTYNLTALVGQRVNSFSEPMSGTNQFYPNMNPPGYYGTMQCTVVGLVPADINNITATFQ